MWRIQNIIEYLTGSFLLNSAVSITLILSGQAYAQSSDPTELPLLSINQLEYQGAFRLPADSYGDSELNFSEGPLEYNSSNHSIFIVGHNHHQAIAEFQIPALVQSTTVSDLNMAGAPLQIFSTVLDRASNGNTQDINRIGGMELIDGQSGPELLVNAYEYYDAAGDNSHTTLVLRNANDIAGTPIDGYLSFEGGAGHTSGWISPIPSVWQSMLGGTHITGQSSGIPIIGRTSVGPSAFSFDPLEIVGTNMSSGSVSTTKLLDFSLENPLAVDLSNSSGNNDIWTHLSRAVYGFIPPETRTYMTLGFSGGHASKVCYKCTQSDGNLCGGYCANNANDYSYFYWLWDILDLLAVKSGAMNSYDVRPYAYGELSVPFDTSEIGGGTFDPASGLLYLSVQRADQEQGQYANPPIIAVYQFNADPGGNNPGNPGGGGSGSATIGKLGKKTIMCVSTSDKNMCRFDKPGQEGEKLYPLKKAIKRTRKVLRKVKKRLRAGAGPGNSKLKLKRKTLKETLSKGRQCKRGELELS